MVGAGNKLSQGAGVCPRPSLTQRPARMRQAPLDVGVALCSGACAEGKQLSGGSMCFLITIVIATTLRTGLEQILVPRKTAVFLAFDLRTDLTNKTH